MNTTVLQAVTFGREGGMRWYCSGECGKCGGPLSVRYTHQGTTPRYTCRDGSCVTTDRDPLDDLVIGAILLLTRRLVDPLPPDPNSRPDTSGAALSAIGLVLVVMGIQAAEINLWEAAEHPVPANRHWPTARSMVACGALEIVPTERL